MRRFTSYDATMLAYRVAGDGAALICLAGGPGRSAGYFGDLGDRVAQRLTVRA